MKYLVLALVLTSCASAQVSDRVEMLDNKKGCIVGKPFYFQEWYTIRLDNNDLISDWGFNFVVIEGECPNV